MFSIFELELVKLSFLPTIVSPMRRAMLRRSCPMRGPFQPGQIVMYWIKRNKPNRQEVGRWHGPAKVVFQEGQSVIWISHGDRLLRCAPENIRPAALREWNSQNHNQSSEILKHSPDAQAKLDLARELGLNEDDVVIPNETNRSTHSVFPTIGTT